MNSVDYHGTSMLPNVRGGCPRTSKPHLRGMIVVLKILLMAFALLYKFLPLGIAAILYRVDGTGPGWRTADRSSIGVAAGACTTPRRRGPHFLRSDRSLARHLRLP